MANTAPIVFDPNPLNESTGISISLSSWTVTIQDPNGDTFDWIILIFNGDFYDSSGNGASNGSKSCPITSLLIYSTEYTVQVNVTDSYEALSKYYFYFTTEEEPAPTFLTISNPDPANETIDVELSLSMWSCTIEESGGLPFDWSIEVSNGDSNLDTEDMNGSKYVTITILNYSTEYTVWVNATNGISWTNETFIFTTEDAPELPPVVSTPSPANGSTGISIDLAVWSCMITDPNGDTFNWSIEISNGDNATGVDATNGTKSISILTLLENDTEYTIWVNVTDGVNSANYIFTFTTNSHEDEKIEVPWFMNLIWLILIILILLVIMSMFQGGQRKT
ncbi:MAG TPA: hypothetical protein VMW26_04155 [Methanomassiliicoccales archaeon]|nr:hypothetical protein [Methanomassiliicoccales archaeon]